MNATQAKLVLNSAPDETEQKEEALENHLAASSSANGKPQVSPSAPTAPVVAPEPKSAWAAEPAGLGASSSAQQPAGNDVDEEEEDSVLTNGQILVNIRAYEKRSEGLNAYLVYKIETRVS